MSVLDLDSASCAGEAAASLLVDIYHEAAYLAVILVTVSRVKLMQDSVLISKILIAPALCLQVGRSYYSVSLVLSSAMCVM